jgi:hypothetical protein
MINQRHYLLCMVACMMLSACGDREYTTSVTGVIMDDSTGKPLAGALVLLTHEYYKDGMTMYYNSNTTSDANGEYMISLSSRGKATAAMKAKYQDYTNELRYLDVGSSTIQNFTLAPYDAWIRFKIANKLGVQSGVYASYWNEFFGYSIAPPGSTDIPFGNLYTEIVKVTGGTPVYIAWDYNFISVYPPYPNPLPHLDTIIVPRGDTLDYSITF